MKNTTASAANAVCDSLSEYRIGHATYVVKTTFNPAFRESLTDIIKRLIGRECDNFPCEKQQKQDSQAV